MKKKKKIKKPFKKCVTLAKLIAKERDGYICQKCGKSKKQGYQIQGSHILGVGAHPRLAAEILNIKAMCSQCHRWWHSAPTESGEWFKTKFPDWYKELEILRQKEESSLKKKDWHKMLEELKITKKYLGISQKSITMKYENN